MLVHRIKGFIKQLQTCENLANFDQEFLKELASCFSQLNDDDRVTAEQIKFLEQVYEKRWRVIIDTKDDYTFNPSGNNLFWISLSRDMAAEINKSYLNVLIPTVTNSLDPLLLTRLTDCSELRGFYLGNDGTTLHRLRGLLEQSFKKHAFSHYISPRELVMAPLSLRELFRIREKSSEGLAFSYAEKSYKNFWNFLETEIAPRWLKRGQYPTEVLSPLHSIVSSYFSVVRERGNLQGMRQQVMEWGDLLLEHSVDEVNFLYGQVIQQDEKPITLLNLLLNCISTDGPALNTGMRLIATWLCQVDPSLIVGDDDLVRVYEPFKVGRAFDVYKLEEMLTKLDCVELPQIQSRIVELLDWVSTRESIDLYTINTLKEIYRQRWLLVMGRDRDYTRMQDGPNASWIRLAQMLSGSRHIGENYYRFLMSTLTHDTDPVKLCSLNAYPLSHYVLSENGKSLILLDNSSAHYDAEKTFQNCNTSPTTKFTKVELDRVAFAAPKFRGYIGLTHSIVANNEKPIRYSTVLAVKKLVDGSLSPDGLLFGREVHKSHMDAAEEAYRVFVEFLDRLPIEERERLDSQRIIFHGKNKRFAEVLALILDRGQCISTNGQFFAQLVMDYAPWERFRDDIERRVAIDEMRTNSRKKVVSDYTLDQPEALQRLQILSVSLMTHTFNYFPLTGFSVSRFGSTNVVPREGHTLDQLVGPILSSREPKDVRFLYAQVMLTIVRPSIANFGWTRYQETQNWLVSISNMSIYKNNCFDPEKMIVVFLPLTLLKENQWRSTLASFLDKLVHDYLKPLRKPIAKRIEINIKLQNLLASLPKETREQLLLLLKANQTKVDPIAFRKHCADLLIHRLSLRGSVSTISGFFGSRVCNDGKAYGYIKSALAGNYNKVASMDDLMEWLETKLTRLAVKSGQKVSLQGMADYWQEMTDRPLSVSSRRLVRQEEHVVQIDEDPRSLTIVS